jgi:single-stranded-DNA-specific exonuclease
MDVPGGSEAAAEKDVAGASLIDRILLARGLADPDAVARFCEPKLSHLYDPSMMPGIDAAAERIVHAVKNNERIVIYGDYDVDGITATAILYHIIKTVRPEANVRSYVPHRLEEGYGINCEALKQLKRDGADLVISVDCGITAFDSARTAREIGLDLIITDHHHLPANLDHLPDAFALVHPRLPGSAYPFGELCGAGVAFKLGWRLATCWCGSERVSESLQRTLLNMLPLVALGTIADVVPLVDENRVLTSFGLRLIKQTPLIGLRALIEASGLADEKIDSHKVGFVLGPRLNACGRLGHASEAMRLLCDAPPDEAMRIARNLAAVNQQRQRTERNILQRAIELAEDCGQTCDDCRAIVLAHDGWHPGVVGIVCSRLVERFSRPAVLMQKNGELCKGSARSIDGYSIHAGLSSCAELLTKWGGHDMAAGLSLHVNHLEAFTEMLTEHANAHITTEQLTPAIRLECDASIGELTIETVRKVGGLGPFGRANRRPALCVRDVVIADQPRQIGSQGNHLSMRVRQGDDARRAVLRAVWWNAGQFSSDLAPGMRLDIAIEPKLNEWNGRTSVEAELKDVCVRV